MLFLAVLCLIISLFAACRFLFAKFEQLRTRELTEAGAELRELLRQADECLQLLCPPEFSDMYSAMEKHECLSTAAQGQEEERVGEKSEETTVENEAEVTSLSGAELEQYCETGSALDELDYCDLDDFDAFDAVLEVDSDNDSNIDDEKDDANAHVGDGSSQDDDGGDGGDGGRRRLGLVTRDYSIDVQVGRKKCVLQLLVDCTNSSLHRPPTFTWLTILMYWQTWRYLVQDYFLLDPYSF